nr:aspartate racemase [Todarodes pacificus]
MSLNHLVRSHLEGYGMASNVSLNQEIKTKIKAGEKIHTFAFGQSPFPVMEEAVKGLIENAEENDYVPVQGIPELRQAISDFHYRYDKIRFSPDNIIVGPGSKELIYSLINIFNGDILVISPSWTTYRPQSHLANQKSIVLETTFEDEWRITPEIVEKAMTENEVSEYKLLILCSPDNPSGTQYNKEQLTALIETFRKHNIIVLSDEIYGRICFRQEHVCMPKLYPEGAIVSSGFSKCAGAGGWRIGYHIFPKELSALRDVLCAAGSHTYSCASTPIQYAMTKMLKSEELFKDYLNHVRRIMTSAGEFCYRELSAAGLKVINPYGGFYIMPDFDILRSALEKRGVTTGREMCRLMFKEKSIVMMAAGPDFLRPEMELTTRMCFVNFDGKKALEFSRELGLDAPLPEDFIEEQCTPLYEAIKELVSWVEELLESE